MPRDSRRVVILVCDGLGVGEAPDSAAYGDSGANTLGHVLERHATALPNLERLGLLALVGMGRETGARGRSAELSAGKDTTTGHWEMMGLVTERPFPLYPRGFPPEIVEPFERYAGKAGPRQQGGLRHGNHRRARRRAPRDGASHPVHVGRLGFSGRLPRGDLAAGETVGSLPLRPKPPDGRASGGARDRASLRRPAGRLYEDRQPPRFHRRPDRSHVARPRCRSRQVRLRGRQDRRHFLRAGNLRLGPHELGRRGDPRHGGRPRGSARGRRLHQPRGLRQQVRTPQ